MTPLRVVRRVFRPSARLSPAMNRWSWRWRPLHLVADSAIIHLHMSDRYFAFISYANAHRKWVATLQQDLERCLDHYARTVDPSISRRVFLDQVDLQSGRTWIDQFQEAVDQSDRLILVVSPEALASKWVRIEWQSFFTKRPEDVFPVRIADAELTTFLDPIQWIDFTGLEGAAYNERLRQLFGDLLRRSRRDPPPMPKGLGPASTPEPSFSSQATRDLSRALKVAYRERAETLAAGGDVTTLNETIVGIKRQLRAGPQLQAGDFLLDDRFELLERIGKGGFATVWKAYDHEQQTLVAVKVLHSQYSEDRGRRERFFRGARHMAKLRHPGIVGVLETECEDGGYHFFVMEYVPGGDFQQVVRSGDLSVAERLSIVLRVGEALELAHARDVIHRDVKPANILLDLEGRPKLTDFDLVRAADTTGGTRTGMLGTFLYAAPEALMDGKGASKPADVYGLGMTAVFAVHGANLPADLLYEPKPFLDRLAVPPACQKVLRRALERDPGLRWKSVAAFRAALREATEPSAKVAVGNPATVSREVPPASRSTKAPVESKRAVVPRTEQSPRKATPPVAARRKSSRLGWRILAAAVLVILVIGLWRPWEEPTTSVSEPSLGTSTVSQVDPPPPPSDSTQSAPGDALVEPALDMRFRYIPTGTLLMGSPEDEEGQDDDETQHEVTLTRGFWMGETEVTQGQWRLLMGNDPSYFSQCGDSCPVERVSWFEAIAFANALSERADLEVCYEVSGDNGKLAGEGLEYGSVQFKRLDCSGYRLPTESEWEWAARAATVGSRPDRDLGSIAWYSSNSASTTHRAGEKTANHWGLHDMLGNVWEWTWDWYGLYPTDLQEDPVGPSAGSNRVVRGCSWNNGARFCRSADRYRRSPGNRNRFTGFRLVRQP